MQTASLNLALRSASKSTTSVDAILAKDAAGLPRFVFSLLGFYFNPKLRRSSGLLADASKTMKIWSMELQRDELGDLIDPDLSLRDNIESLKSDLREIHRRGRDMHVAMKPRAVVDSTEFGRQLEINLSLAKEVYEVANELQWALAEHDASANKMLDGFSASNDFDLTAMLARIASKV